MEVQLLNIWEILLIAIGLAMDALAVSISLGLTTKIVRKAEYLVPGAYFGVFQFLMPVIGFFAGVSFADKIQSADHWIAFVLLAFIGGKMLKESFSKDEAEKTYSFKFRKMLILALATSIDALAVGISFAFLKVNIFRAALIIGVITFLISTCGLTLGKTVGLKFKSKAEFVGGLILILIGTKILMEHLFFS